MNINQHDGPIERQSITWSDFVYQSKTFSQFIEQAKRCANMTVPLLIQGETGTGKEMLARACHHSLYQNNIGQCDAPFLVVNCVAMPDDVVESELFGYAGDQHAPYAHSFAHGQKGILEQADGGTIFLDNVDEMSAHLQAKLLRFLYDGCFRRVGAEKEISVKVRIICSTRQNLQQLVQNGQFREDLYFRLNVLNLIMPPLQQHPEDIEILSSYFISKHCTTLGFPKMLIDADLLQRLESYIWPGNVRELSNLLLQGLIEKTAQASFVPILKRNEVHFPELLHPLITSEWLTGSLDDMMKNYEKNILQVLYHDYPSSRKLAQRLRVSHTSIANKLREYKINKA